MKIQINENELREAIYNRLVAEAMEAEGLNNPVKYKNGGEQRVVVRTAAEFIEKMSQLKGKKKCASIGYLDAVEFNKDYSTPINKKSSVPNFDKIGGELGVEGNIQGVVKCSLRTINWASSADYGDAYNKFTTELNNIKHRFNNSYNFELKDVEPRDNSVMTGEKKAGNNLLRLNRDGGRGVLYAKQNVATPLWHENTFYVIDKNGNIVGQEYKLDRVAHMIKAKEAHGIGAVKNYTKYMENGDEINKEYTDAVKALKFETGTFSEDRIICFAGTVLTEDGRTVRFLYKNQNIPNIVKKVEVNPEQFKALVDNRYQNVVEINDNIDLASPNPVYGSDNLTPAVAADKHSNNIYRSIKPTQAPGEASAEAIQEAIRQILKEMNLL